MKLMIDSWAWMEILKGSEKGKNAKDIIKGKKLYTTVGNTYELRYKLKGLYGEKANQIIEGIIGNYIVVDITAEISKRASEIKLSIGKDIGAIDCFTLAAGEFFEAKVITGDPHMEGMKDVIYL